MRVHLAQAGRPRTGFGLEAQVGWDGGPTRWREDIEVFAAHDVDGLAVSTLHCGLTTVDEHLDGLEHYRRVVAPLCGDRAEAPA